MTQGISDFGPLGIVDFDHIEFAVADLDRASELLLRLGFEKVGIRQILERKLTSYLLLQNRIAILLSTSSLASDPVATYVATHGDGVFNIAFRCKDAVSALELAVNRGAELADSPRGYRKDFGKVQQASVRAYGDIRHSFIDREGHLFAEGFDVPVKGCPAGYGLERIDHFSFCVDQGQLLRLVHFYEQIFGLTELPAVDQSSDRQRIMQSPGGTLKVFLNEPGEDSALSQEFLAVHHGPGIDHLALQASNLAASVRSLQEQGVPFCEEQTQGVMEVCSGYAQIAHPRGQFFYEIIQRSPLAP